MGDVSDEGAERDHHLYVEFLRNSGDLVAEGSPPEFWLNPAEDNEVTICAGQSGSGERVGWPLDIAIAVVVESNERTRTREVVEVLRVDRGKGPGFVVLGNLASGSRSRVTSIVPALEGDNEDWIAEIWSFVGPLQVIHWRQVTSGCVSSLVQCDHTVGVQILEVSTVSPELVEAFGRLIPQLSSSNPPPTASKLQSIVDSSATTLLVAEEDGYLYGSLTLVMFPIPTGVRAWIEDVVVDGEARGKGVGRLLNEAALERASEAGATTVDLTSRPSREAANRLYQRLGFVKRETNVYRFDLGATS